MALDETQIYQVLERSFGYSEFLPAQKKIILDLLAGKSLLAVMPTGSGKSLCFQLPALIKDGYALVVSPMLSLMKDQVMQLRQLGIAARMHNSLQSIPENDAVLQELKAGELKLLYMAPESILRPFMLQIFAQYPPSLLAIDEAHCISMWGHDFRPEYRQLSQLRQLFPHTPCFALTATAIPKVRKDICNQLHIPEQNQVLESFNRNNLLLVVEPKRGSFDRLLQFLSNHSHESGIIYCATRKTVDEISSRLIAAGYKVLPYHAGLSDEQRHQNQESFINDETPIMVATIAFGMGINKSNIRYIVHLDLPKSLESYYQEIGRAGRDGLPSTCLLLFSTSDLIKLNKIIYTGNPTLDRNIKNHLEAMVDFCRWEGCRRIPLLRWFGERYQEQNCGMCDYCLGDSSERKDASLPAKKFLSAIYRAQEQYSESRIIKILRGSRSQEILSAKDDQLSVWGIGKDWTESQWYNLFHCLKKAGAIAIGYPGFRLSLTDTGWQILRDQIPFEMPVSMMEIMVKAASVEMDAELYELLTALRKKIATQEGVPPYVVFSDRSLMEMSRFYPQSSKSFLNISGVGEYKLQQYGDQFIELITSYCQAKGIADQVILNRHLGLPVTSRTQEIGNYVKQGHSIEDAASIFKIQPSTVMDQLHRYLNMGGIIPEETMSQSLNIDQAAFAKIEASFALHGKHTLKLIHEDLNDEFDYNTLKLVRMILMSRENQ